MALGGGFYFGGLPDPNLSAPSAVNPVTATDAPQYVTKEIRDIQRGGRAGGAAVNSGLRTDSQRCRETSETGDSKSTLDAMLSIPALLRSLSLPGQAIEQTRNLTIPS